MIPGVKPKAADNAVGVKLLQNSAVQFKALVQQVADGRGCGQLGYYIDHARDEGLEPLWRGVLSIAKACEDGARGATWVSSLHPYDEERMQIKLREIKGPYPCTKFNTENPGVCESCQHWGRITNPLALARETFTDNTAKAVEVSTAPPARAEAAGRRGRRHSDGARPVSRGRERPVGRARLRGRRRPRVEDHAGKER